MHCKQYLSSDRPGCNESSPGTLPYSRRHVWRIQCAFIAYVTPREIITAVIKNYVMYNTFVSFLNYRIDLKIENKLELKSRQDYSRVREHSGDQKKFHALSVYDLSYVYLQASFSCEFFPCLLWSLFSSAMYVC